jgi:hypothetical protein
MRLPSAFFAALLVCLSLLSSAGAQTQSEREVPVENDGLLRVNISGDVRFVPVPYAKRVRVYAAAKFILSTTRTGSRVTISITGPTRAVLPFAGASGVAYEIYYPANMPLDVREYGGTVRIDDAIVPVDIYNAVGNISIDRPHAVVTAEDDVGNITVTNAHGPVDLAIDKGTVSAELAPDWSGSAIRMQASNGNLNLSVPSAFRGHYDLSTGLGSVSNPLHSDRRGPLVFMFARTGNVTVAIANPK